MKTHHVDYRKMPPQLTALKINKRLKSIFWKKFLNMRQCNGPMYASDTMKKLKELLMSYIADVNRVNNLEVYLKQLKDIRLKADGWMLLLFKYANTDPITCIQFLKMYTTEPKPLVSTDESAENQYKVLSSTENAFKPSILITWLDLITKYPPEIWRKSRKLFQLWGPNRKEWRKIEFKGKEYNFPPTKVRQKNKTDESLRLALTSIIYPMLQTESGTEALVRYFSRWGKVLASPVLQDFEVKESFINSLPRPESYIETHYGVVRPYGDINGNSFQFEEDLMSFGAFSQVCESLEPFVDLMPDVCELFDEVNTPDEGECLVGHIHHIPKKGTVKRRPIAAPNRVLQSTLLPMKQFLDVVTKRLPRNAQYNQNKFDDLIQQAVNTGYAGSVDLSQATDYLPYSWFRIIADRLGWFQSEDLIHSSYDVYNWMIEQMWANNGEQYASQVSYTRGQPLGTWPSFDILTITHTLICEVCSFYSRDISSPYFVLGDDVVFTSRRSRYMYINFMKTMKNPLSLHKSYDGRMVEFAGKIFVKNQVRRYTPDVTALSLNNLFDYQRCAKVNIPYGQLPKSLKAKFNAICCKNSNSCNNLSHIYQACQCLMDVPISNIPKGIGDLIRKYYSVEWDKPKADTDTDNGMFPVFDTVLSWGPAPVPKYKILNDEPLSLSRREVQSWYKDKVRPVDTMYLVERMCFVARSED